MREPSLNERLGAKRKIKGKVAKKGISTRSVGGKKALKADSKIAKQERASRPYLPRVAGDKALARLHHYEKQLELLETDISRKKPDKPSFRIAGNAKTLTPSASGRAGGRTRSEAGSPYFLAFSQKEHLAIAAP